MKPLKNSYLGSPRRYRKIYRIEHTSEDESLTVTEIAFDKRGTGKTIVRFFIERPVLIHGHRFDGLCQGWGYKSLDAIERALVGHFFYYRDCGKRVIPPQKPISTTILPRA
jgi:hypothetical protein